jgi:hypothetical protein
VYSPACIVKVSSRDLAMAFLASNKTYEKVSLLSCVNLEKAVQGSTALSNIRRIILLVLEYDRRE